MFLSFMRDAYAAIDAVRRVHGQQTNNLATAKVDKFKATYYESSGMAVLVAPLVKINFADAYQRVLVELRQQRRAYADHLASGNEMLPVPDAMQSETDSVLETLGASMREVLGLKNQRDFVLEGRYIRS
jgi:hypothetical protein